MAGCTLLQETQNLLKHRARTLTFAKIESDLPVCNRVWLSRMANGKINETDVNRVQILYEYLTGQPLLKTKR
jgi:hypothetical protein